ncbi:hydroxyacylglutathione hydrolase [Rhodococcus triatomae]|uniref:Hydroxyacylglutathione hydrolase n=1 Tax=Rhodococcus triatomae TaxID=300028 RepID=A0A1G8KJR8_9NOCA|nr:MBL fold metallo-hydrolase [Rhodococcus triatomae]SDI43638.1 hydroxyacylglutathione hydrolase [Rhodococcus triatomae]
MLVTGFPAGMFQTNCYILAHDGADECVVVDPGQDAAGPLGNFLADSGLTPAAVLLTHGHLDHIWNAREVCARYGVPAYIHPEDRYMLTDPGRGIGEALKPFVAGMEFTEPDEVIALSDGDEFAHAGIEFLVEHTPGHTQGSVVFRTHTDTDEGRLPLALTGDTLFQGSIGRTDLPGGDHEQLLGSIATRLLVLPDDTVVLPGHGPASTVGDERRTNPFLAGLTGSN